MGDVVKSVDMLYEKAKKYTETSAELLALNSVDKTADVLSSLTSRVIIVMFFAMFTLFINVGLSLFIGSLLNEYYLGFFIISAFYLVVALMLYVFKDKFIKIPVTNLIILKLLKSKKSDSDIFNLYKEIKNEEV